MRSVLSKRIDVNPTLPQLRYLVAVKHALTARGDDCTYSDAECTWLRSDVATYSPWWAAWYIARSRREDIPLGCTAYMNVSKEQPKIGWREAYVWKERG